MSLVSSETSQQRARRLHLWQLWNRGFSLRECVQQTAEAFECSERLVYYDWERRHYWLAQEYELGSLDRFTITVLAGLLETLRETQGLAHDARAMANPAVRLGRLKLLRQIHLDLLKYAPSAIHALMTGKNVNPFWTPSPLIDAMDVDSRLLADGSEANTQH